MDDVKLAKQLIELAKQLSEDEPTTKVAVPIIRYVNPKLNPVLNKIMPYIGDKKTMFELIVVLLRRTGNWGLAKRLLPLMKADLGKDLDVEETDGV